MAASEAETGRFAPAGALIVMALVVTGFAIMWDSPYQQFQGNDGASDLLVIVLLALAELAVMAPTVVIVARMRFRLARATGNSNAVGWLSLIVGSLLTLVGAVMGPASFIWISRLSQADLSERVPLLIAYIIVPLAGVLLLFWAARLALRDSSQRQGELTQD
jgi:threonine/homoserine/homoserine lactone efflux protein